MTQQLCGKKVRAEEGKAHFNPYFYVSKYLSSIALLVTDFFLSPAVSHLAGSCSQKASVAHVGPRGGSVVASHCRDCGSCLLLLYHNYFSALL